MRRGLDNQTLFFRLMLIAFVISGCIGGYQRIGALGVAVVTGLMAFVAFLVRADTRREAKQSAEGFKAKWSKVK